ncbi:MAG: hypothetical protein KGJ59_06370 [Bacteroidota bacterium]|nr:hypothetical protein [Bacteroidota bacterium]
MFEQETEQLKERIRRSTIQGGETIPLRSLTESGIPENVKAFFRAEVLSILAEERKGETRSSNFDYTNKDVAALQEQIDQLLIDSYALSKKEFDETLDKGIHFLFNYLCRPQWTLGSFLFDEANAAPVRTVLLKLRCCTDYNYFPTVLERFIRRRGILEMTSDAGRNIVRKIDSEVTKNLSSSQLAQLAKPVFEFVAYARSFPDNILKATVPTRALMYFFDDKQMMDIHEALLREREKEGLKEITLPNLVRIIEHTSGRSEPAPQELPNDNQFTAVTEGREGPSKSGIGFSLPRSERPAEKTAGTANPFHLPPTPLPPLFSLDEERSIIKKVFQQDEDAFHRKVEEILATVSWDEASLIIDHHFTMSDVDPFTKEAILFTNSLQQRFRVENRP